jgi:hypothetical protein
MRNLSNDHIKYVLGIDIPLTESIVINERILAEQLLYESFLTSITDYAKDKINKVVTTISDWKDAGVVLSRVLSDANLLDKFSNIYWNRFTQTTLKKLKELLGKYKLPDLYTKYINPTIQSISSLTGWKKFLASTGIGSIIEFIIEHISGLGADKITDYIKNYLSTSAVGDIVKKLTDFRSYIGWLEPIIKGVEIFYKALKPVIDKFHDAFSKNKTSVIDLEKYNEEIQRLQTLAGII